LASQRERCAANRSETVTFNSSMHLNLYRAGL
jgi:hypothetical protein